MIKNKKESLKKARERMEQVISVLSGLYPDVKIQLDFTTEHQLLVSTILSAQCTDARVNEVTKGLFRKYVIPEDFLKVPLDELEKDIYSTGYYKAKAKHIQESTRAIIDRFGGQVPGNMEDLLSLPGVGRKTANVILGHCFDEPGIVVDTHVIRISNLMGFVDSKDAVKIEMRLQELIAKDKWVQFTHYIINHGRITCIARRPKCPECAVAEFCPSRKD
jgi:endonuclease-3